MLSESGKMPLPVYEKVFSAAENSFVSETYENLCCLKTLSKNFSKKYIRILDKRAFCHPCQKNRNVIYQGKTCNIMDVAAKYKGDYCMNFKDRHSRSIACKMNCIPVKLCEFPKNELTLVAVYGFGAKPMLLLSNLKIQEQKHLCHIVAKVYLMR